MIYAPFTLVLLFLLLALLGVFLVLVEMRVLAYAYRKVGVRPRYAFAVMLLSLLGSHVNVPLYAVSGQRVLRPHRSEEHTSELQSRLHLVSRLLLEKKNTKK